MEAEEYTHYTLLRYGDEKACWRGLKGCPEGPSHEKETTWRRG